MSLPRYGVSSGGRRVDIVALQGVMPVGSLAGHGHSGLDVKGRVALRTDEFDFVGIEADAGRRSYLYRTSQIECPQFVVGSTDEHDASVAGSHGNVVWKAGGKPVGFDKALVVQRPGSSVSVPYRCVFELNVYGGCRYPVVEDAVASAQEQDGQEGG